MHSSNKLKNKKHMIISTDAEKAFDKIQLIYDFKKLSRMWEVWQIFLWTIQGYKEAVSAYGMAKVQLPIER